MELFLQATAAVLLAVIMFLVLNRQDKEIAMLLTVAVCTMVIYIAGRYIESVMDFLRQLQQMSGLGSDYLSILMKVVGIGFLSEIACLVCTDAGNASLGKTLQIAGIAGSMGEAYGIVEQMAKDSCKLGVPGQLREYLYRTDGSGKWKY